MPILSRLRRVLRDRHGRGGEALVFPAFLLILSSAICALIALVILFMRWIEIESKKRRGIDTADDKPGTQGLFWFAVLTPLAVTWAWCLLYFVEWRNPIHLLGMLSLILLPLFFGGPVRFRRACGWGAGAALTLMILAQLAAWYLY